MDEEEKSNKEPKELSLAIPEEKKIALKPENTIDHYNETLSDIDENEIQQFILTPEESALKSMLWHHIHRDWIEEQNMKKGNKSTMKHLIVIELESEKKEPKKRRKKTTKEVINAPDPVTALHHSSKLANRLNTQAVKSLFEDNLLKKVKLDMD